MVQALGTLGRYRLIRKLAQGGMAEVFLGKSYGAHGFEKPVAIKKILPRYATDVQFVTMLIDEARISSLLTHPNIVPVIDFNADGESCYLVMEYVPGRSLSNLYRALDDHGRTLSTEHLIHVVKETAAGLHHAHIKIDKAGKPLKIVHRDVSPQNILLSFEGFVKVIDFGIARARDRLARTEQGMLKGKVRYLSPEQVEGDEVDGRADLFALGIVLWEGLARRPLFEGASDMEVMDRVMEARIPDVREHNRSVPDELARALSRALARKPEDRFPSCEAFSAELRGILARMNPDYDPSALGGLLRTTFADEIEEDSREEAEGERLAAAEMMSTDPEAKPLLPDTTDAEARPLPRQRSATGERDLRAARREGREKGRRASEARRAADDSKENIVAPPVDHREPTLSGDAMDEMPPPDDATPTFIAPASSLPAPVATSKNKPVSSDPTLEQVNESSAIDERRRVIVLGGLSAFAGALIAVVAAFYLTRVPSPGPAVSDVARVELKLDPQEARVIVDGAVTSVRDGQLLLEAGQHRMRIQAEGYVPEERVLDVAAGENRTEIVRLTRRR